MVMTSKISLGKNGTLQVPDKVTIPYIEGDGIGADIWNAAGPVFDAAISKAYNSRRQVEWKEVPAGQKAFDKKEEWLPEETLDAFRKYRVGIKGPLTTPVGGGFRSINVALRHRLDLYACIRPVAYIPGVPSPVREPEKVDMVVFRENNEDVYAGIEWRSGTPEAGKVIGFLNSEMGTEIRADASIGVKPMSPYGSKRIVRRALQWALDKGRKSVTMVHKGNIMKFTEGAFRDWGYELAQEEFPEKVVKESDLPAEAPTSDPRVIIKDRIADAMFQQVLLRPDEYDVLAMPNLNGDYLSDALAAQVGGLGMAPGGNIGDETAVFEAIHGTAPKYAGKDMVNPSSFILSGALMFEYIGWMEAAERVRKAVERTIQDKTVTYDLARRMTGAREVKCSEFGKAVADNM
jgi:isocitrate dehydrogenase